MAFMPLLLKRNKNNLYYSEAPLEILERNTCQKCRIAEEVIHRVGLYINTSLAVMSPITQPIMCSLLTSCNTLNMKYKDHLDFFFHMHFDFQVMKIIVLNKVFKIVTI